MTDGALTEEATSDGISDWTIVVAIAENGVIGRGGELPWKLRSDLRRFKALTMGHCLLMGRKTFESIGRALPGRQTLVLSRSPTLELPAEVRTVSDLAHVPSCVEEGRRVMVVGGAIVYQEALPRCSQMWITRVLADVVGDTRFPEIDWNDWFLDACLRQEPDPKDEWATEFQRWKRKAEL